MNKYNVHPGNFEWNATLFQVATLLQVFRLKETIKSENDANINLLPDGRPTYFSLQDCSRKPMIS